MELFKTPGQREFLQALGGVPVDRDSPRATLIGVAGGSGAGKTTVVRNIIKALGDGHVSVLEHDRYYRDHPALRLEERASLNYDHPDALETDLLVRHVEHLRAGAPVEVPIYDFARHARKAATDTVLPRTAIIVEGILIFTDAALRRLMDVKVYVDTDDDTRFIRRLQRDITERGRTVDSVIDQYLKTVKPMHLEFVEPGQPVKPGLLAPGPNAAIEWTRALHAKSAPVPLGILSFTDGHVEAVKEKLTSYYQRQNQITNRLAIP